MLKSPQRPSDDTVIWRYIGLDKFIDLLLSKTIKFTSASIALDQNEINWILKNLEHTDEYKKYSESASYHIERLRNSNFISCWTMKKIESRVLWATYLDNTKQGVAIKSTVGKFKESIDFKGTGYNYKIVDYRNQFEFNELQSTDIIINSKNTAYQEEAEVRFSVLCDEFFLVPNHPQNGAINEIQKGILDKRISNNKIIPFDVDLDILTSNIMISPYCSEWQKRNIEQLIKDYAPSLVDRILNSTINEKG